MTCNGTNKNKFRIKIDFYLNKRVPAVNFIHIFPWYSKYSFYSFTQNSQQGHKKRIYFLKVFEIPIEIHSFYIHTKVHLQTQRMQSQLSWSTQKCFQSLSSELFTTVLQFRFLILFSVVKRRKKYILVFQKARFSLKLKHTKKMACLC